MGKERSRIRCVDPDRKCEAIEFQANRNERTYPVSKQVFDVTGELVSQRGMDEGLGQSKTRTVAA